MSRKYYLEHREEILKRQKESYWKDIEKSKEKRKLQYEKDKQDPNHRAKYLMQRYLLMDKTNGFENATDIDYKWIVENIFTKPCAHCGETDWYKLGCNRLDNSKPHTKDNIEPCCYHCNCVQNGIESRNKYSKKVYQYTTDGELVKVWNSTIECGNNGYNNSLVASCCRGLRKTHKGYRWSYEPL